MLSSRVWQRTSASLALFLTASLTASTLFKISTVSPDGSAWMKDLRTTVERIAAQSDNRVLFRVYGGGVMGDDLAVLRKMRARQLQGGIFQTGSLERLSSNIQLYNLPMTFQSFDEVTAIRDELDSIVLDSLNTRGFVAIGLVGLGFANAMSKHSETSIHNVRSLKVWTPKGDAAATRLLQTFGIVPIPLSLVDVLAGLQTGLIDTIAAPPVSAIALQWHTQLDFMLDLPFMYIYSVFVLDSGKFNALSDEDQALIREEIQALLKRVEQQNYADHDRSVQALLGQGIEMLSPSSYEVADWQAAANEAGVNWVESGILTQENVSLLHDKLAAYRSSGAR